GPISQAVAKVKPDTYGNRPMNVRRGPALEGHEPASRSARRRTRRSRLRPPWPVGGPGRSDDAPLPEALRPPPVTARGPRVALQRLAWFAARLRPDPRRLDPDEGRAPAGSDLAGRLAN